MKRLGKRWAIDGEGSNSEDTTKYQSYLRGRLCLTADNDGNGVDDEYYDDYDDDDNGK